jgi:hypothetical protein
MDYEQLEILSESDEEESVHWSHYGYVQHFQKEQGILYQTSLLFILFVQYQYRTNAGRNLYRSFIC